jgi:hypothetical protein
MMYSVDSERSAASAIELVDAHEAFFRESIYRTMTFDPVKTGNTLYAMMCDSDTYVLVARDQFGKIAGFFEFGFESPWMAEEVMLCINFFVIKEYRTGICSQLLMDAALKICKDRSAKLVWASSTAGFSDNGCNERAFRMFLKRNRFREMGTFLVWEPKDE